MTKGKLKNLGKFKVGSNSIGRALQVSHVIYSASASRYRGLPRVLFVSVIFALVGSLFSLSIIFFAAGLGAGLAVSNYSDDLTSMLMPFLMTVLFVSLFVAACINLNLPLIDTFFKSSNNNLMVLDLLIWISFSAFITSLIMFIF